MAKPETHLDAELMATSQENPRAEAAQPAWELVMHLAPPMPQPPSVMLTRLDSHLLRLLEQTGKPAMYLESATTRLEMLQEKHLLVKAMQLLPEMVRRELANRSLPATSEENSLARAEQLLLQNLDLARPERRRLARARLPEVQLPPLEDSPVPSARAPRCSPDPGPCAFSRETLVARKCNRGARCGGRPIYAQYRPLRNRRAPVGCDNKNSRSQHKRAHHVVPFPIAALDKYLCLPRRTAD
jgi:hypothetical protein